MSRFIDRITDRLRTITPAGREREARAQQIFNRLLNQETVGRALQISGAHHTSFNGDIRPLPSGPVLGVAEWGGRVGYSYEKVLKPLQEMARNAGRAGQSQEALTSYRYALEVVLHEQAHFLSPENRHHQMASQAFQDPAVASFEEGVTQAWTKANMNNYLNALGAEQLAPGISSVSTPTMYPQYVAGAEVLAVGIGQATGQSPQEVLRQLNNEDAGTKFPAAATMVFNSTDLAQLAPPEHHDLLNDRLRNSMQQSFGHLRTLQGAPQDLHVASVMAGHHAVASAQTEVAFLRNHYISQSQAMQQQAQQQTQVPVQQAGAGGQAPNALSPDLQRVAALAHSGTAAASGIEQSGTGSGERPDHRDRTAPTPQRGKDGPDR